jgi:cardiolipin synthase
MEASLGTLAKQGQAVAAKASGNDEASLNIYDAKFADKMTKVFEEDLKLSTPYDFLQWQQRPLLEKFAEVVLVPIRSQL